MSDSGQGSEPKGGGFDGLIATAREVEDSEGFDWQEESEAQATDDAMTVLCFELGQGSYAVGSEYLREIVSDLRVTPVPGAPGHVRGVTIFRRQVLGVLNLHQWLDPAAGQRAPESERIIIVESGPFLVGIEVDSLSGLEQWPVEALDRAQIPDAINTRTRRYAAGMKLGRGRGVVLLDVPKLLRDAAVQ